MQEGKEIFQHPWQPIRLNGWNSVCSKLQSLCSTWSSQGEEPCETPKHCSTNITSQAIKAEQGFVRKHCHNKQRSTQLLFMNTSRHQVLHLRCFKRGLQLTVYLCSLAGCRHSCSAGLIDACRRHAHGACNNSIEIAQSRPSQSLMPRTAC